MSVSSETVSPKGQPASSKTNISARTAPGERERVATLSHPVGSKGAERPTPAPSETVSPKGQPASSKTNISARTAPESSRGCEPSRLPIEADDLRVGKVACPLGKQVALRPTKRNRRFRLVAPGADFFRAGACLPEKKSLPCRFRARKSEGFQRNLRKGGAEGNPSPPPPGELERAAALSNFQSRGFPQEIVSFSEGWQWRGSLLPRPPHARSSAVIKFPNDST